LDETDERFKEFPQDKSRRQVFEQSKEFLTKKVKKDFEQAMNEAKFIVGKIKSTTIPDMEEEVTEMMEKDERFRKMGQWFLEERTSQVSEYVRTLAHK